MTLLSVSDLSAGYGGGTVLYDVDLDVDEGSFVSIIGPNGAGKTTLFETINGFLSPSAGTITFRDLDITASPPETLLREGIVYIPQGTNVFKNMTTLENLRMGSYLDDGTLSEEDEEVFDIFPRLAERKHQKAGTMSGGEQQMLELARGLIAGDMDPDLLLLDEPSTGLAPKIVKQVFDNVRAIHERGTTVVLVEQQAKLALEMSDYVYVIENGTISHEGPSEELREDPSIRAQYLGG
jgi:ABC-type branched-subunit amino acid transport system ATPase component